MSKPEKPRPPDDAAQSTRFLSTAKEQDADLKGDAFERAFRAITPVRSGKLPTSKRKPKG